MKKCIIAILLVFVIEFASKAQSDGFFMYNRGYKYIENDEYEMVLLPKQHGSEYNYYADNAPLESGCLLLLGMGLVYMKFKYKQKTEA